MEGELKGEFKYFIQRNFGLNESQYQYFKTKAKNRSVDSVIHKMAKAPYSFYSTNSEFKKYIEKHESALWLLDNPHTSKVINAPDNVLDKNAKLNSQQIRHIFIKAPQLFDADFFGNHNNSPVSKLKYNLYFYQNILGLRVDQAFLLEDKIAGFLMKDIFSDDEYSVINQIRCFCEKLNVNPQKFGKIMVENVWFARIIYACSPESNVMIKTDKMLELGLPGSDITKSMCLYKINPNRIKFKYMVQRYAFGIQTLKPYCLPITSRLNLNSDQLVYARAMYLVENKKKYQTSLQSLYGSENFFKKLTGINNDELVKKYPLTKTTAKQFEQMYNYRNPYALELSEKELSQFPDKEIESE